MEKTRWMKENLPEDEKIKIDKLANKPNESNLDGDQTSFEAFDENVKANNGGTEFEKRFPNADRKIVTQKIKELRNDTKEKQLVLKYTGGLAGSQYQMDFEKKIEKNTKIIEKLRNISKIIKQQRKNLGNN